MIKRVPDGRAQRLDEVRVIEPRPEVAQVATEEEKIAIGRKLFLERSAKIKSVRGIWAT